MTRPTPPPTDPLAEIAVLRRRNTELTIELLLATAHILAIEQRAEMVPLKSAIRNPLDRVALERARRAVVSGRVAGERRGRRWFIDPIGLAELGTAQARIFEE